VVLRGCLGFRFNPSFGERLRLLHRLGATVHTFAIDYFPLPRGPQMLCLKSPASQDIRAKTLLTLTAGAEAAL
jgi:hypothetical protein